MKPVDEPKTSEPTVTSAPPELPFRDGEVRQAGEGFELHLRHPQWGGYSSHAIVDFDSRSGDTSSQTVARPGCFELTNLHDGEFPLPPGETEGAFHVHCCSAGQFVDFGITILEAQIAHQRGLNDQPVRVSAEWVERTISRLRALGGM